MLPVLETGRDPERGEVLMCQVLVWAMLITVALASWNPGTLCITAPVLFAVFALTYAYQDS